MKARRWYDKHVTLRQSIDMMETMDEPRRERLTVGIMKVIQKDSPTLLDDFVSEFPLGVCNRRWYDQDPNTWLVFNGLKYAGPELITLVENYLETELVPLAA